MQIDVSSILERHPGLVETVRGIRNSIRDHRIENKWRQNNCPMPMPPHLKRRYLKSFAVKGDWPIFIETGTFIGETTAALKKYFEKLDTIELSLAYYTQAKNRLACCPNVKVWHGDSIEVLPIILESLSSPAMFWLDGHYSGGDTAQGDRMNPIEAEMRAIASHRLFNKHLILVDDARLFDGSDGYPRREAFRELVVSLGYTEPIVKNDIIHMVAQDCNQKLGNLTTEPTP